MGQVEVIDRRQSVFGDDIQLQKRSSSYEIISNGVFLMSTENGRSEREMVTLGAQHMKNAVHSVLIGGLGVGITADEAVHLNDHVQVHVVEIEPSVVEWQYRYLYPFSNQALEHERTAIIISDIQQWLRTNERTYDLICLDTDNGPDWMVHKQNASLYGKTGLELVRERVSVGGAVSFWSASPSESFLHELETLFDRVYEHPVSISHVLPPDYVYVACRDR
ncbi:spermidine synthase [Halalkalibacterium halodurans]|uniref:Spermine/spermidine synthase n=1 Tax=Halalkalibacterium halodurans TaxID=86665 RepID=A0A0M0KL68_ALKHA|nr:spermidine synthase [Halalkalibacterium halodurans]MED4164017.1 spermidine synthase [Halalkalibacterium halodurans]TPE71012.1 spermine/spermidine synthase [Halalkalibacterium halodurans]